MSNDQARLDAAEKDVLLQALRDYRGDKRSGARAMSIALSTPYERLTRHRIG